MSDWKSLIAVDGEAAFKAKPPKDKTPDRRAKLLESIAAVSKSKPTVSNGLAELSFKIGTKAFLIEGQKKVYVPENDVSPFLTGLKNAVSAGELDSWIVETFEAGPQVEYSAPARKRKSDDGYDTLKPKRVMSEETKAKISATRLAREAAKKAAAG